MSSESSGRTAIAAYRALPALSGWGYLFATSLGRLPLSIVPLAILTLATSATGSIAVGGFASAAAALGEAIGAPVGGALSDRFGQRKVLMTGVVLNVSVILAFTLMIGQAPDALAVLFAGLAGLTLPQVGPLSRVRWLAMSRDDLSAAFAFEGVIDEIVYIIGPALVGIVAVVINPWAALVMGAVLIAVFVTQFALHRTASLVPRRRSKNEEETEPDDGVDRPQGALRTALMVMILTGMLAMGVFFGATQTGLTAFAEASGLGASGALLYSVMAVGSAVTTVAMVALPETIGPWTRWILSALGLLVGAVGIMLAPNVWVLVPVAVLAGVFQGPLLLTIYSVAGTLARPGRAGALMTLAGSGVVLGIGVGAALAGSVAAVAGSTGAFAIVVGATVLLTLLGVIAATAQRIRGAGPAPAAS
ncbi:MFS transporter [Microbacterium sediminicola]|uniref:MFS transporter n=1 Tax=Microbacterium sediminicola TaxID=415210 RepID=A0ABN2I885_9MICO